MIIAFANEKDLVKPPYQSNINAGRCQRSVDTKLFYIDDQIYKQ